MFRKCEGGFFGWFPGLFFFLFFGNVGGMFFGDFLLTGREWQYEALNCNGRCRITAFMLALNAVNVIITVLIQSLDCAAIIKVSNYRH